MPADHEPALAGPLPMHDPIPDDVPVIAPPVVDAPVVAPPVVDVPVVAPPVVDVPVVVAPLPDPAPVFVDRAPFATHVDPRYADTRNGWIEDDDDYPPFVRSVTPPAAPIFAPVDVPQFHLHVSDVHRTDLPVTFLQDIPPPRQGKDLLLSSTITYHL
ncbi:36.4 kDa proline-rich protein-like [Helianthus annuus]|uniref:36.4 kDa proline-rich protein-like n=1 Tax=Helianthus annuus TaxID=4232 RepID=UPI000B8FB51A|nr:36.4 kDa proline-rich protein-like [Helianthus annuus]